MASVTKRIKEINQPRGGYLPPKLFEVIDLQDGITLHPNENIHATLVGLAVDYLSRASVCGSAPEEAFGISLKGAALVGESKQAEKLLKKVKKFDFAAIEAACQLAGYDVCFRAGPEYFNGVEHIKPDLDTLENIDAMVHRSEIFFEKFGPVVWDGFTFEGGYTDTVTAGDGDFLTLDTLWDYKVSAKAPTNQHTLQLLMYYIMGMHSKHDCFKKIKYIGIFNPRLNKVYRFELAKLEPSVIEAIEKDVICY